MGAEWIEISEETAREIEETKQKKGKVIAVGTTTVKALESFSDHGGPNQTREKLLVSFYPSPLSFSHHRWSDHQFPSSEIDADHAGFSLCGEGLIDEGL